MLTLLVFQVAYRHGFVFGVSVLISRQFKISLQNAKRSFYRAANSIFNKIGRIVFEEVIIQLIKSKCIQALKSMPVNKI